MNYIQGIERNQAFLFPSTIDELIPEDDPVRVIDVFVNTLSMQELGFTKSRLANTGRSPYHPKDLLKLYLYGYFNKIRSSRNLARECKRNIEVIWLLKSVKRRIETLKNRKAKYKKIEKQLKESDSEQVSTTDSDSRLLVKNGQPAEAGYNEQVSIDDKNKLIADYKTTNQNDRKQLHDMATRTKEEFKVDNLDALADKGYHNGEELHKCQKDDITTYVGVPQYGNNKTIPASGYHTEDFTYDKQENCYICPQGFKLLTNGKFYNKPCRNGNFTLVKHYHTKACKSCKVKHLCTNARNGRVIERSQYQEAVDANTRRIKTEKEKYLQRQMIVEHPFGTIKRTWGYNYVLVKGLDKVDGEFGLIFLCYNLKRVINMIGATELITKLIACSGCLIQICVGIMGYLTGMYSLRKSIGNKRQFMPNFSMMSEPHIFALKSPKLNLSFCTV